MMRSKVTRQAGVTLTELLVVLVIVSILATIAVPVYINKAENARISVAQLECRQYAEAEESCAIHHGFYVPLQVLDDIAKNATGNTNADSIDGESSVSVIDQSRAYIDLNTQVLISATSTDARVANMVNHWQGPFITPQRFYTGPETSTGNTQSSAWVQKDMPLDPWGNAYRFYAPGLQWGVIGSNGTSTDLTDIDNMCDGVVTTTDPRDYDRYAIVSYGPDGTSENDANASSKDDIVYFFGKPNPKHTDSSTSGTVTATPTI